MAKTKETAEEVLGEHDSFGVKTEQGDWFGKDLRVKSAPLIDTGTGKPFILRNFWFKFDPQLLHNIKEKKAAFPSKQELFNSVWQQIRIMLWGDGLVASEDVEPRISFKKKGFFVHLLCEPKTGVIVADTPRTLRSEEH